MAAPSFPPLLRGRPAVEPFAAACASAGEEPGTVFHDVSRDLRAALVLAPEVPLEDAVAMIPAAGMGLASALGALGPPETAVTFEWPGGVRVGGAACGRLRAAASTAEPGRVPDWLVVGVEVPFAMGAEPGRTPERTALGEEGFGELSPARLLESWARHTLVWIDRWEDEGPRPLHDAWRGLVEGLGGRIRVDGEEGHAPGLDERFGLVLGTGEGARVLPLWSRLERAGAAAVPAPAAP